MTLILFILTCYGYVVISWVLYLAIMNLARYRESLNPVAKVHAYALFYCALLMDVILNAVVGTLIFMDLPKEWLMTARLKRYHMTEAGTWRDDVAHWICDHLLNQFDPKGGHC